MIEWCVAAPACIITATVFESLRSHFTRHGIIAALRAEGLDQTSVFGPRFRERRSVPNCCDACGRYWHQSVISRQLADHTVTDGVEHGPFAGAPPALCYSAAAAILAGRKAGMTSFANRSRSSS